MRRRWRNWATSLVGHLFSILVAFQFWSLSPPIYNTSTCPVLGSGEVMGWGRSQWVCCPWQPLACAQACRSLQPALPPVMGQGENAKLCLQAAYLFHSPATLHLFRFCSGCTQGWDFLLSQHPRRCLGCGDFLLLFQNVVFPLLISLFYSQSLQVLH